MSVLEVENAGTYLTFTLGGETYAVGVQSVREVLDSTAVTRVPRMPEFMRGVINLRGSVIPVVDLRMKFGMKKTEEKVGACIIVLEVRLDEDGPTVLGVLADSVKEVFDLAESQVEPPPRIGTNLKTEFIRGMGTHQDGFIIILDLDHVFLSDELVFASAKAEEN